MQFRVNFTDNITLTYDLVNEEIVDSWVELLNTRTINDFCPHNHYIGYVSDEFLNQRIQRLYELADIINQYVPERIIKIEMNRENYQHAINTMHVHFPELKNDNNFQHIWGELTEYNDLIHWLESTLLSRWGQDGPVQSKFFRITFDFNKSQPEFRDIPESAYKLFDPHTLFGELKIHYTHVGRHAQELFLGRDMVCPKDQFVPQHLFTASVRMYFTDDFYINQDEWKKFYEARGKEFWGMDITDPKLAFGYIKIGQLSNINIDGSDIDIPININERHKFREQLSNTTVLGWQII